RIAAGVLAATLATAAQAQIDLNKLRQQLNRDMQAWAAALAQDFAAWRQTVAQASGNYLIPTPGTTSAEGYIQWQGAARRYLVILPQVPVANAPAILLLHPRNLAPEKMGNLTRAGRLAANDGAVVLLPEAQNGAWNEDPAGSVSADDVGFLSALIDYSVAHYGVDKKRVYATGYSSGGFMAARLGCQASGKLAGVGEVAATMRASLEKICVTTHALPVALIDGTSDAVVPYNGEVHALDSAPATAALWAAKAGCNATAPTTHLPNKSADDGTTVDLARYRNCGNAGEVRLYTVNQGGHTWPSSPYGVYTLALGRTTRDIDATLELWNFLSAYRAP
ncbi:MAG TPA: PHB depolymerase family esterase, partial [Nevskiaceae bacterium]|nr:PHB depolymerase family esterase [Nevskiaceae bacterium]